ncbi:hypothetical protein Terro_1132 [Terriglobus roseus DSM 18391]|uniref:Uncharacterized protein n=1 Tax=Terriglobus roseus (strain DSM 18391 / NRRL B-41598 / KBS 63) TaxID=926566 RepID=I3ZDY3_TERRK|nr:hypothetical protein [Terriglobus roseus]AFL87451.1 hypothetical protein Terro_1132 [Terriglobus roseus DSM 18391]
MFSAKKTTEVSDEQAMQEMMALLDDWKAPEPSPWFDARMMARFREEVQREPEGFFARLRDRFLYGNTATLKPMLAGAMALLLVAGGGSWLEISHLQHQKAPAISATVEDLQILDNNDQAIQQMNQLLDDDTPES